MCRNKERSPYGCFVSLNCRYVVRHALISRYISLEKSADRSRNRTPITNAKRARIFFDYLGNVIVAVPRSATITRNSRTRHLSLSPAYMLSSSHIPSATPTERVCVACLSVRVCHCSGNARVAALPFTKFLPFIDADPPSLSLSFPLPLFVACRHDFAIPPLPSRLVKGR